MKIMRINKKYIVDGQGNPGEVIISCEDFRGIEEMPGLDSHLPGRGRRCGRRGR